MLSECIRTHHCLLAVDGDSLRKGWQYSLSEKQRHAAATKQGQGAADTPRCAHIITPHMGVNLHPIPHPHSHLDLCIVMDVSRVWNAQWRSLQVHPCTEPGEGGGGRKCQPADTSGRFCPPPPAPAPTRWKAAAQNHVGPFYVSQTEADRWIDQSLIDGLHVRGKQHQASAVGVYPAHGAAKDNRSVQIDLALVMLARGVGRAPTPHPTCMNSDAGLRPTPQMPEAEAEPQGLTLPWHTSIWSMHPSSAPSRANEVPNTARSSNTN